MIKVIAGLAVAMAATNAAVFCIASGSAMNTDDIKDRRDAFVTTLWSLVTLGLCAFALTLMTGCQAAKTIIDTCRDGLCR